MSYKQSNIDHILDSFKKSFDDVFDDMVRTLSAGDYDAESNPEEVAKFVAIRAEELTKRWCNPCYDNPDINRDDLRAAVLNGDVEAIKDIATIFVVAGRAATELGGLAVIAMGQVMFALQELHKRFPQAEEVVSDPQDLVARMKKMGMPFGLSAKGEAEVRKQNGDSNVIPFPKGPSTIH